MRQPCCRFPPPQPAVETFLRFQSSILSSRLLRSKRQQGCRSPGIPNHSPSLAAISSYFKLAIVFSQADKRSLVDSHTAERILFRTTAVTATACNTGFHSRFPTSSPILFRTAFHEQIYPTIIPALFQYGGRHRVRCADDPAEPSVWCE